MKTRKIDERIISDRQPEKLIGEKVRLEDLCSAFKCFFEEYLKGAAKFNNSAPCEGDINISTDYLIYSIKLLIKESKPDTVLNFSCFVEDNFFKIEVTNLSDCMDTDSLPNIIKYIRHAGFSVDMKDGKLILSTQLIKNEIYFVYSHDKDNLMRDMVIMFFK